MNATIKKAATSTKNFVYKHRVALSIAGTLVVCQQINQLAMKQHNEFLKEKGLYDEFYTPEDSYE